LGTAHDRRTSPTRIRRSKCSVVASWSCTTNRDTVTARLYSRAANITGSNYLIDGGLIKTT
jgi:hypothetical protein